MSDKCAVTEQELKEHGCMTALEEIALLAESIRVVALVANKRPNIQRDLASILQESAHKLGASIAEYQADPSPYAGIIKRLEESADTESRSRRAEKAYRKPQ